MEKWQDFGVHTADLPASIMNNDGDPIHAEGTIYYREVLASLRPGDAPEPQPIPVPPGYGVYFRRTFNNGWTDNRDVSGQRPLQGFDFQDDNEFIREARRAHLLATVGYDRGYLTYETYLDYGLGGMKVIVNPHSVTWQLKFYMNDDLGRYADNRGTANIDVSVYRHFT